MIGCGEKSEVLDHSPSSSSSLVDNGRRHFLRKPLSSSNCLSRPSTHMSTGSTRRTIMEDDDMHYLDGTCADEQEEYHSEGDGDDEPCNELPLLPAEPSQLRIQNAPDLAAEDPKYRGKIISTQEYLGDAALDGGIQWDNEDEEDDMMWNHDDISDNETSERETTPVDNVKPGETSEILRDLETQHQTFIARREHTEPKTFLKARQCQQQKRIWDDLLELSIYVQRLVSTKEHQCSISDHDHHLSRCISELEQVQRILVHHHEQPCTTTEEEEEDEPDVSRLYGQTQEWETSVIEPILAELTHKNVPSHHSTRLAVMDQTILTQVNEVCQDPSRWKRKALREDTGTYDDVEFYHQLLREFVEASGNQYSSSYKRKSKRKKVDTKANKGKKIRYEIHAKLENYMVPSRRFEHRTNFDHEGLYRSIFDGRGSLKN